MPLAESFKASSLIEGFRRQGPRHAVKRWKGEQYNWSNPLTTDFNDYKTLVRRVMDAPAVGSRLGSTKELVNVSFTATAGDIPSRPKLSVKLGFTELLLVLVGRHDAEAIKRAAPRASLNLFTESMSYGPRLKDQLPALVDYLREDPLGRRAVLHVSTAKDGFGADIPCTQTIQFLQRNGTLSAFVSMRSWDVVRGVPYDIMVFGGLLLMVAACIGVDPGTVNVRAGSCHIYETSEYLLKGIDECHDGLFALRLLESKGLQWEDVTALAEDALGDFGTHHTLWEQGFPFPFTRKVLPITGKVASE